MAEGGLGCQRCSLHRQQLLVLVAAQATKQFSRTGLVVDGCPGVAVVLHGVVLGSSSGREWLLVALAATRRTAMRGGDRSLHSLACLLCYVELVIEIIYRFWLVWPYFQRNG